MKTRGAEACVPWHPSTLRGPRRKDISSETVWGHYDHHGSQRGGSWKEKMTTGPENKKEVD